MKTDKDHLIKGVKHFAYTFLLMFTAPIILWQAFKNQEHTFYIPVLIVGLLLAIAAIAMGFYSVHLMMNALFNTQKKKK
jgi:cytochrome bd-type quinol oxidase subunit 1